MKLFNEEDKHDLAVIGAFFFVLGIGFIGAMIIFVSILYLRKLGWYTCAWMILLGTAFLGGSICTYSLCLKEEVDEIEQKSKKRASDRDNAKLQKIEKLQEEVDRLSDELIRNNQIVEQQGRAIFGEKAKIKKEAQKKIQEIEEKIQEKTDEIRRLKKELKK